MADFEKYTDYRDYFFELFLKRKKQSPSFSYQYCSTKLKTSRSYLKLVFTKKRHITLEKLNPICNLFKLSAIEKQWALFLFLKNTASDKEMKSFLSSIVSSYNTHTEREKENFFKTLADSNKKNIFTHWLNITILGLMDLKDFKWDAHWIFSKITPLETVTVDLVKSTMSSLVKSKLVENVQGKFQKNENYTKNNILPWDIEEYQRFKLGQIKSYQAIDLIHKGDLESPGVFQMYYLSLNEKDINKIVEKFDQLESDILNIAQASNNPTRVFMCSNNLFALSKK